MELFSKTSLAVGSTDDVPGCDWTHQRRGQGRHKLRQDKRKKKVGGFGSWGG